ncbi:hypothetical protein EV714DRAFT_277767 [Schizophyllum commune]
MSGIDIRFRLDPDELRAVLKRSSIVLEITFDHRDCVVDMAIYGRLTRLVGGLGPLFPALRSVSITMPKRYKANFVPRLPPALAAFCIGSMSLSLHIRRLLSAFPHVTTAFVVRASTVPCFSPNPNSLHLLGVSITTLLHIMDPAAPWGLGKLDVSLPSNATRRELRDLVTAIVDRCASLSHLKIGLDFDQPGRWIITRRLFTKLSHLQRLTHLDIEAPICDPTCLTTTGKPPSNPGLFWNGSASYHVPHGRGVRHSNRVSPARNTWASWHRLHPRVMLGAAAQIIAAVLTAVVVVHL